MRLKLKIAFFKIYLYKTIELIRNTFPFIFMELFYSLEQIKAHIEDSVVTIGNFDGVHKGHQALFNLTKKRARIINSKSVALTFNPHPLKLLQPEKTPLSITTFEQKLNLIKSLNLDFILCLPFTKKLANVTADDFIKILVDTLKMKELVIGHDYAFGKGRKGSASFLKEAGKQYGFKVHHLKPVYDEDMLASSTAIRNLIIEGNMPLTKRLLGRNYRISGAVIHGMNRGGRLLGFPTANIVPQNELIPKSGVYAVYVIIDDITYYGVTNIGVNPTFPERRFSIETHILDFMDNLEGKSIDIIFVERIRSEQPFQGPDSLAFQIKLDIQKAREILSSDD